ncbi:MAG: hypothetical protein QME64_04245, partial [bacterium]|nr:hypothetical protein [bacterium]
FGIAFMHEVAESDPKAAFQEGKRLYTLGKKEEATQKFLIVLETDSTNYFAYAYLAKLNWEKKALNHTLDYLQGFHRARFGYLIPEPLALELITICEAVAQEELRQKNWARARTAFDLAGNIAPDMAGYLRFLASQYSADSLRSVRDALWPNGIAVTLEDFENTTLPVLKRWVTNPSATVESHTIVRNPVHRGNNAELLKIRYTSAGPDYWSKNVYLLLQAPLAIRAYVTGKPNTRCQLVANMRFAKSRPEQKIGPTGACFSNEVMLKENQWVPLIIPDVYAKAMDIAKQPSGFYNPRSIQLEMIAVNTFGNDCELYIDDIEAFLPK